MGISRVRKVLVAFGALAVFSIPNISHAPWIPFAVESDSLAGGLGIGMSIALWNYLGWDNASTVQGEVRDASRSYPRALSLAVPLVVLAYLIPLSATLGASDWTTWRPGGWPQIARVTGSFRGGSPTRTTAAPPATR